MFLIWYGDSCFIHHKHVKSAYYQYLLISILVSKSFSKWSYLAVQHFRKKKQQNCSSTGNSEWRSVNSDFPWSYCSAAKTRTKHFLPPREVIDKGRAKKTDGHRDKEDRQTVQRQYGSNGLRIKRILIPSYLYFQNSIYISIMCESKKFPGMGRGSKE